MVSKRKCFNQRTNIAWNDDLGKICISRERKRKFRSGKNADFIILNQDLMKS